MYFFYIKISKWENTMLRNAVSDEITIELEGIRIPCAENIICPISKTPLRIPVVIGNGTIVEVEPYLNTLPDQQEDSNIELIELKFSKQTALQSQAYFQQKITDDKLDREAKRIMTKLATEISEDERKRVASFAKTKGATVNGLGIELTTLNSPQVTTEEKSVIVSMPDLNQNPVQQADDVQRSNKTNYLYNFSIAGTLSAGLFIIKEPMSSDNFIHIMGGAIIGDMLGSILGLVIDTTISEGFGRRSGFRSSPCSMIGGILSATFSGAMVCAVEVVAVKGLDYPEEQAKYIAPAVVMTTSSLIRFAPNAIRKTAGAIQNCGGRLYSFFCRDKNENNIPTTRTPLLSRNVP